MRGKVEICGVNTARLKTLTQPEMDMLLRRSREGDDRAREMLIEGKLELLLCILKIFGAEPEGESFRYCIDVLSNLSARKRVTGCTGVVYASKLNSFVEGGGKERSFSES